MMDERSEFEKRLESMAKRHDHMERARRQEERALLLLAFDDEHGGDEDPRHVSRKLAFAEEDEGASDIELETGCLMQCLAPGTAAGA